MWIIKDELGEVRGKSSGFEHAHVNAGLLFEEVVVGEFSRDPLPVSLHELWPLAELHGWTVEEIDNG